MSPIDIIVIIGCVALGIYVVVSSIKNKKNGKTSCGCGCANCKNTACKANKQQTKKGEK